MLNADISHGQFFSQATISKENLKEKKDSEQLFATILFLHKNKS